MLRLHPYRYHRPAKLEDALTLLKEHAGDVMPIAGGTDLVPNMKHGLFTPGQLVALKGVEELHGISERDGELVIGSAETLTSVATHALVKKHFPALAFAARSIAHPMIRNTGTIGGNICLDTRCTYYNQTFFWRQALGFCLKKDGDVCHVVKGGTRCVAAHSADTPPLFMCLDATVDLATADATRSVPLRAFFSADGIWNTVREPGELVTHVRIPLPPPGLRAVFAKVRERKSVDFPLLSIALAIEFDDSSVVRAIALTVAGLGAKPRMIGGLDKSIVGQQLTPDVVEEVAKQAHRQCHPLDNLIVDTDWRRAMVAVYVRRACEEIVRSSEAAA